jgi:hypothetical protein
LLKIHAEQTKMISSHNIAYETQIEEASKRAKCKKVLYLYDEYGNRHQLGVFSKRKAEEIKKQLNAKKLINRLSEFEIRTTLPDTNFKF